MMTTLLVIVAVTLFLASTYWLQDAFARASLISVSQGPIQITLSILGQAIAYGIMVFVLAGEA